MAVAGLHFGCIREDARDRGHVRSAPVSRQTRCTQRTEPRASPLRKRCTSWRSPVRRRAATSEFHGCSERLPRRGLLRVQCLGEEDHRPFRPGSTAPSRARRTRVRRAPPGPRPPDPGPWRSDACPGRRPRAPVGERRDVPRRVPRQRRTRGTRSRE